MKFQYLFYHLSPPCHHCPYRLGLIKTVFSPCPQCKMKGYQNYKNFKNLLKEDKYV